MLPLFLSLACLNRNMKERLGNRRIKAIEGIHDCCTPVLFRILSMKFSNKFFQILTSSGVERRNVALIVDLSVVLFFNVSK